MALTPKLLQRSGWRYQAEYLISTHAAFGTAALTMAEQTRRRSLFQRVDDFSDILEPVTAEPLEADPPEQVQAAAPEAPAVETADAGVPEAPSTPTADACEPEASAAAAADSCEPEAPAAAATDACVPERPDANAAGAVAETAAPESAADCAQAPAQPAEIEPQSAPTADFADAWAKRMEMLTADAAKADQQTAQLQEQLDAAREELALKDNEGASLRTSLDLFSAENKRLCRLVAEKDVEAEAMRAQLEQLKSTLLWTEDERIKLLFAADTAAAQHRAELSKVEGRIEAEAARATAAEQALADLKRRMLTPSEYNAFQKLIIDTTLARNAAARRLDILEMSLQKKEQQVRALQDARSKLIDGTNSLLETFSARDAALARAELAIKFLVKRIAQLEAEAKAAPGRNDAARPAAIVPQRPRAAAANGRSHP